MIRLLTLGSTRYGNSYALIAFMKKTELKPCWTDRKVLFKEKRNVTQALCAFANSQNININLLL